MRNTVKKILSPVIQKIHALWLKKPRRYSYKDTTVTVVPGVFPPFLTLSTKLLLNFIETIPMKHKTFLELGCGCGIISVVAAKKGAWVTSSDINQTALDTLRKSAEDNYVTMDIVYSDLFENLAGRTFDYIVINPPYYPKEPKTVAENAWYCGQNFDYFEKLFPQLSRFITPTNSVYMILSEDCDLKKIKSIAAKRHIHFGLALEKKTAGERNFIFRLTS